MTLIEKRTFWGAVVAASLALAVVSCAKVADPGTTSVTEDNGGVTTAAAPAPATMPAPARAAKTPTEAPVLDTAGAPPSPAPQIEAPAPAPGPAAMQAMTTTQASLEGLATGVAGARVRFVDCTESAACTARLEATSLSSLRDLLQAVGARPGGIGFAVREQLDGFTGRTFVADVTLGGTDARAVPTDENALLTN